MNAKRKLSSKLEAMYNAIYKAWHQAFLDATSAGLSPEVLLAAKDGIDIDSQKFANAMRNFMHLFDWSHCIYFTPEDEPCEEAEVIARIKHMTELAKKTAPDGKPVLADNKINAAEMLYRMSEQIGCAMPYNAGIVPELDDAIKELVKAIASMNV